MHCVLAVTHHHTQPTPRRLHAQSGSSAGRALEQEAGRLTFTVARVTGEKWGACLLWRTMTIDQSEADAIRITSPPIAAPLGAPAFVVSCFTGSTLMRMLPVRVEHTHVFKPNSTMTDF